ncbi:response regulator [Marinospirillum perlucidum]|uniref:response regulator n=1 Tax=Marinospirillum perlucidum TaxID=1982602 RepID=UPI000DF33EE0|nr:response regulator [Marinospirillum perlucidum]
MDSNPLICIVDDDEDQANLLKLRLHKRGYSTRVFNDTLSFQQFARDAGERSLVVIMDQMFPEGELAGSQVMADIHQTGSHYPLIFLSARDDLEARLAAHRAGASAYFSKPLDSDLLIQRIEKLLEMPGSYRVLLMQSDAAVAETTLGQLESQGMQVKCCESSSNFLNLYDQWQPEVLLLDARLPEMTGPELAALLYEYKGLQQAALVFLADEEDADLQEEALSYGADDFLIRPVDDRYLTGILRSRAERVRRSRRLSERLDERYREMRQLYQLRQQQQETLDRHAIVSVANRQGEIIYVNERFCQISGYSQEELLGQDHRLLKSGQHPPEFYQDLWRRLSAGLVWQGEICNRRKDGRLYWVESTITPFFDENGQIREYVSIRTDITHQKEVEQELKNTEEWQRQLAWERGKRLKEFACLSDLLYLMTDFSQDEAQLLQTAADRIPAAWQLPELTGVCITYQGQTYTSEDFVLTPLAHRVEKTLEGLDGEDEHLEILVCLQPSAPEFLEEELHLQDQLAQQLLLALGRTRDHQATREARDLAKRASKAKSNFLSNLSHEIRTPMNAILGFAQMLEYEGELSGDQKDSVNEILKAGQHLQQLLDDVLDLARVEAGKVRLSLQEVALNPLVTEALRLLQGEASETQVTLENLLSEQEVIFADPFRLKQVLINLLSNAIKYNREGGQVIVSTWAPQAGWLRLQIEDTGPGIAPQYLEELSQPFNRLDAEARGIKGTGIGLTISRQLVVQMGGQLGVNSQMGLGSVFWVELPVKEVFEPGRTSVDSIKEIK